MSAPGRRLLLALLLVLLLPAPRAGAAPQEAPPVDIQMPDDLQAFWRVWWDARQRDDEEDMDEAVRRNRTEAEDALNVMLDDLSRRDVPEMHFEVRLLAWSMDRVQRTERFIERVRLVLDLELRQRYARADAMAEVRKGGELEQLAIKERTDVAWVAAMAPYQEALAVFRQVGDREYAAYVLSRLAEIERQRGRPWERAQFLTQLVEEASELAYNEPLLDEARSALERLLAEGVDPGKEKPTELAEVEAEKPAGVAGGLSLDSWAGGSKEEVFEVVLEAPKKGLPPTLMPTFHPVEQHQLWPLTWVGGEGPDTFDTSRAWFRHDGKEWSLSRPGMSKFAIDVDGDGEPEVEFSASTSPARVDVPIPGKEEPYPLMVAVLGDREKMFSVDTNYAPNNSGARLRFGPGGLLTGKVLGESWKILDANFDGNFGPAREGWDDLVTIYDPDEHVGWWSPDAVLIGRDKSARPLSTVMRLEDGFYNTRVDQARGVVVVRKLDLQTGFVQLDGDWGIQPTHLVVRETGGKLEGAFFDILPERKGGKVELPTGTYEIAMGRIEKGKKTTMDQARIYRGRSQPIVVETDKTTTLEFGAPYTLEFDVRSDGEATILDTLSIRCFGRGGEEYAALFDEPLQPDVEVRVGKKTEGPEKLRRAGLEEWQTKNNDRDNVLWFPVEYRYPETGEVEFRLSQKSHSLLGGPIASDWIR